MNILDVLVGKPINQRGRLLEWVLLARGNDRVFTASAPWYAGAAPEQVAP